MNTALAPTGQFRSAARKPYTPVKPGAKAMTIAVGFLCDNGKNLIMAADRQFTSPGFFKYHRKKYVTKQKGTFDFAFMFSGEPGTFKAFQQRVFGFFDQCEELDTEIIRETIEGVLTTLGLRDFALPPSFFLLAGFNDFASDPQMIVFDGKSVFVAESEVYLVGCGDTSLLRYLSDHLYSPQMNYKQGVALSAYLIKKATQYVGYCGEPIDVILGCDFGFGPVAVETIADDLKKIENQEQFLSTLLVQTPFQP